jgi:hypothetical protein
MYMKNGAIKHIKTLSEWHIYGNEHDASLSMIAYQGKPGLCLLCQKCTMYTYTHSDVRTYTYYIPMYTCIVSVKY